jgi:hypothetical protein
MTAEAIVAGALVSLAGGNVYPDVAPAKTPAPWITYQAVGGQDFTNLDNTSTPLNCRMQVTVWSTTRAEAADVMSQVRAALVSSTVQAIPIGGPVSTFEADTLLYGSTLDFSIFY